MCGGDKPLRSILGRRGRGKREEEVVVVGRQAAQKALDLTNGRLFLSRKFLISTQTNIISYWLINNFRPGSAYVYFSSFGYLSSINHSKRFFFFLFLFLLSYEWLAGWLAIKDGIYLRSRLAGNVFGHVEWSTSGHVWCTAQKKRAQDKNYPPSVNLGCRPVG